MHVLAKLGAASVFAATLMTGAHAQEVHPYLPNAGTSEVGFSATINFEPSDSYGVVGRYGYFFNRHFELGLDASYTKVKNGSSVRLLGCGRVRKLSLSDGHTVVALRRPVRWGR